MAFEDKEVACKNYTKSIESHLMFQKAYPDKEVVVPLGFNNFVAYVEAAKIEIGCKF